MLPALLPVPVFAATMTSMNDPDPREFHLIFLLVGVAQIQFHVDFQIGSINGVLVTNSRIVGCAKIIAKLSRKGVVK
jgi:hypothetical protein